MERRLSFLADVWDIKFHDLPQPRLSICSGGQRFTDTAGNQTSTIIELDPWGYETSRSANSAFQPHKYNSYEREGNGSDYVINRELNNWYTRFYQPDPYDGSYNHTNPQSFNRYSYVNNDPVNAVDPSGLEQSWNPIGPCPPGGCIVDIPIDPNDYFDASNGGPTTPWTGLPILRDRPRSGGGGGGGTDPQNTEQHGETIYTEIDDQRGGSKLSPCARDILGKIGFGRFVNLDDIRVHIGIPDWVTSMAQKFGGIIPKAITIGNDIYWRSVDDYNPSTVAGLAEMSHELTHTLQFNVLGASMYFKYLGQWAKNGFRYGEGMKLEKSAMEVERLLNLSIPQRFGNEPCKNFRH